MACVTRLISALGALSCTWQEACPRFRRWEMLPTFRIFLILKLSQAMNRVAFGARAAKDRRCRYLGAGMTALVQATFRAAAFRPVVVLLMIRAFSRAAVHTAEAALPEAQVVAIRI